MLLDCFAYPCYTQSILIDDKLLFSLIRSALAGPFIGIVPRIHTLPCDLPAPEEGLTHLSSIFSPHVVLTAVRYR